MLKRSIPTIGRTLMFFFFLTTGFALTQSAARADTMTFQGFTRACFNCVFPEPRFSTTSHLGLTFHNSTFDVTTTPAGNASLGTAPLAPGNFNNFGSFTLSTEGNLYNGTFQVDVIFSNYGFGIVLNATVTGEVTNDGRGNLFINFANTPFSGGLGAGGSYQIRLNDVSVAPGGTVALTGDILNATRPVPEPATMILLGTGLAGVAGAARRRRRARREGVNEPQPICGQEGEELCRVD